MQNRWENYITKYRNGDCIEYGTALWTHDEDITAKKKKTRKKHGCTDGNYLKN